MIGPESIRLFRERCDAAAEAVIVTHMNPDGDAVGSAWSLACFLRERGSRVRLVNQDPTPEYLEFIEPPERIEVYETSRHDALLERADRVFLVDNSAPDRLGSMEPAMRRAASRTLCIDHHPMRDAPWADTIVDVDSCATTAMIYDLATGCGWKPDLRSAWAIYLGLATDTGFFRFNSTNARTHEIAAELLRLGVDSARTYQQIYERNSPAYVRLLGHALAGLRLAAGGAVASVLITTEMIRDVGAEDVDPTEITTSLLAMHGVRVALLFRELGSGRVKVSLRSKGPLDVHRLATEFGGGGHRNASGIVMAGTADEAIRLVTARASALLDASGDGA
jgi:bifunctional oligoribonuclease and PAP phosphatase NrnA